MKRRGFIKTGLVTVAAGASGCTTFKEIIVPISENISQSEMANFIKEMDESMDRIFNAGGNYIKSLVSQTPTEDEQNFFRSSLRSLLLVGNFGSLSIQGQVHPWMQKRMYYTAPDINYSITTAIDILKNMSEETKEDISSVLNDDPVLGERILETLDLEAQAVGVPRSRRRQMRVIGTRIVRRLKHSPDMLINEYVSKAEKLIKVGNSEKDLEGLLKSQMGEHNFLNKRNVAENAAIQWNNMNLPYNPVGYSPIKTVQTEKGTSQKKSESKIKGLKLLGIGGISTVVGWLIIAIAGGAAMEGIGVIGLILGVTVGPILIIIALLAILISAIANALKK